MCASCGTRADARSELCAACGSANRELGSLTSQGVWVPSAGVEGDAGNAANVVRAPSSYPGSALGLPFEGPGSLATTGERLRGLLVDVIVLSPIVIFTYVTRPTHVESRELPNGAVHLAVVTDHRPPLMALLFLVPAALYVILAIGIWGRTVGQRVMGLEVMTLDGGAPDLTQALRRWSVAGIFLVITAVHYIPWITIVAEAVIFGWMFRDVNRQGLHDKFAGVVVVRARSREPQR